MSSHGPCTAAMSSSPAGAVCSCSAAEKEPRLQGAEKGPERAEEGCSSSSSAAATTAEEEQRVEAVGRDLSEASLRATANGQEETEEEEDEDEEEVALPSDIDLGPRLSIKEQLDKDKDDESLRRWKEQLLGSVDLSTVGETLEPDVKITSLCILSPGRPDMVLLLPAESMSKSKEPWFTLKEGSAYRLKFTFSVADNIVSGLCYTNTVWKAGIRVDSTKEMLGTFSTQAEPYTYLTPEETTPSGIFARGSYSARTKFLDDDRKCYLKMNYTFDIRRDWP